MELTRRIRQQTAARVVELDSHATPEAEALLMAGEARLAPGERPRRERVTTLLAATGFLAVAAWLFTQTTWSRPLSPLSWLVAVVFYAASRRVRFPVGGVWAYPTQLAFVPMLFVLPVSTVPLTVGIAAVLARIPDVVRGRRSADWFISDIGDCWYSVGPVLVLILAGTDGFSWGRLGLYVGAFGAQLLFDATATLAICWFAERIRPRVQLPHMSWTYMIDASLSAVAIVIAAEAVGHAWVVLLMSPLTAVLALFARERRAHFQQSLALSSAYRGTTFLLADLIEADDDYTGKHSHGVLELSLAVAERLGLSSTRRRNVEFAALLHDVGKVHVPKEIINKRGPLTDQEWDVIRRHTVLGEAMLKQVGGTLTEVGRIVRASHERFDGGGYPDGLSGTTIPIEARIVTACDAYSAMTTDRSYRRARSSEAALAEMQACAGSQFDPSVVVALEHVLRSTLGSAAAASSGARGVGTVLGGRDHLREPQTA